MAPTVRDAAAANLAEAMNFAGSPDLSAPAYPVPSFAGLPCPADSAADYEEWHQLAILSTAQGYSVGV